MKTICGKKVTKKPHSQRKSTEAPRKKRKNSQKKKKKKKNVVLSGMGVRRRSRSGSFNREREKTQEKAQHQGMVGGFMKPGRREKGNNPRPSWWVDTPAGGRRNDENTTLPRPGNENPQQKAKRVITQ